jgi:hypothetical protein
MIQNRVVSAFAVLGALACCQSLLAESSAAAGAKPPQNAVESRLNRIGEENAARMPALLAHHPGPQRQGLLERGRPAPAREKDFCVPNDGAAGSLCLLGRFEVFGVWDNPFANPNAVFDAGTLQLTDESGYLYFQDQLDIEIPIKVLDFCDQGVFKVFAAGLTDFGVAFRVLDKRTGIFVDYTNNDFHRFDTIIDEAPPFPCP